MSIDRESEWLADIVDNIERIFGYTAGLDFDQFVADPMRCDATERCIERITEATIRIGADRMVAIHPSLPPLRKACLAALKESP